MDAKPAKRYEQLLRKLDITIPSPFNPDAFVAIVAEARGRPITVMTIDTSGVRAPGGLWISTYRADYVVVDANAPQVLRDHILMHEIAHMICDHQGLLSIDPEILGLDDDIVDPAVVERVLGRDSGYTSRYATEEEQEAEGLASVIAEFAKRRSPVPRPRNSRNGTDAVLDRFSSALAGDRQWLL